MKYILYLVAAASSAIATLLVMTFLASNYVMCLLYLSRYGLSAAPFGRSI